MERIPFETPSGKPVIACIGEEFTEDEIVLMEQAVDELNITEDAPRYTVIIDKANRFSASGAKLPEGTFRVMLQGSWVEDKDLGPLVDRMDELKAEAYS